jgi:GNAT superfamily N-acetyltransferase
MKKFLLILIFTGASMHAMENLRVEPFDYKSHHLAALNVYQKACPGYAAHSVLLGRTKEYLHLGVSQHCDVLIGSKKASKEDTIIGFMEYLHKQNLQRIYVHYLAEIFIDPEYQKQGYGRLFMEKLEEKTLEKGLSIIQLYASSRVFGFYENLGYTEFDPYTKFDPQGCFHQKQTPSSRHWMRKILKSTDHNSKE